MTDHIPVLLSPIIDSLMAGLKEQSSQVETFLDPILLDTTFGGGGHSGALLEAMEAIRFDKKVKLVCLDRDLNAVERGRERFKKQLGENKIEIHHARMSQACDIIKGRSLLGLMADLGFSSDQLNDSLRGLSFKRKGPLDMRLDTSQGMSAADLLEQINEEELVRILQEYGEERFSKRIAHDILQNCQNGKRVESTQDLVNIVVRAIPARFRHGRIHAATRTFQALRIAVNEELDELDALLGHVIMELVPGGRAAILSFHSLEDRRVKYAFRQKAYFKPLHKKPLVPDRQEIADNPRARSAKLRMAERIIG